MQPREFREDSLEHEVLRDCKGFNVSDGHVLVFRAFGGKYVVVTDVAEALVVLGYHNFLLTDVIVTG